MDAQTLQFRLLRQEYGQGNLHSPRTASVVDDVWRHLLFGNVLAKCGVRQVNLTRLEPSEVEERNPL